MAWFRRALFYCLHDLLISQSEQSSFYLVPVLLAKMPSGWVKLNIQQRGFEKAGEAILGYFGLLCFKKWKWGPAIGGTVWQLALSYSPCSVLDGIHLLAYLKSHSFQWGYYQEDALETLQKAFQAVPCLGPSDLHLLLELQKATATGQIHPLGFWTHNMPDSTERYASLCQKIIGL